MASASVQLVSLVKAVKFSPAASTAKMWMASVYASRSGLESIARPSIAMAMALLTPRQRCALVMLLGQVPIAKTANALLSLANLWGMTASATLAMMVLTAPSSCAKRTATAVASASRVCASVTSHHTLASPAMLANSKPARTSALATDIATMAHVIAIKALVVATAQRRHATKAALAMASA